MTMFLIALRIYVVLGLFVTVYIGNKVYGNYFRENGLSDRQENRYIFRKLFEIFLLWPMHFISIIRSIL